MKNRSIKINRFLPYSRQNIDQSDIEEVRKVYEKRLGILVDLLCGLGLRPAHRPKAGFFTLWESPTEAFGEKMASGAEFNFKMIDEVGVVGVHFSNLIRYAVCADIQSMKADLEEAFGRAAVKYT